MAARGAGGDPAIHAGGLSVSAPGLGLAVVADFRVTCKEARFAANVTSIGFHPGFGLTLTLSRLVGQQKARWLMLTGCRITGEEAHATGLAERLVPQDQVRTVALEMAHEIAKAAPLAVQATRASLNTDLVADYKEGVEASTARRDPNFIDT